MTAFPLLKLHALFERRFAELHVFKYKKKKKEHTWSEQQGCSLNRSAPPKVSSGRILDGRKKIFNAAVMLLLLFFSSFQ